MLINSIIMCWWMYRLQYLIMVMVNVVKKDYIRLKMLILKYIKFMLEFKYIIKLLDRGDLNLKLYVRLLN